MGNLFSCFIIGEGTLPIQCAQILINRGHGIYGIITGDNSVRSWAEANKIPHIQPTDNIREFLSQQPFDYLFSIVNPSVLPQEILELPRQFAINYHDAPLPRYAGLNATSWALMNQEKTHGVTWHVMAAAVDAGDILKQVIINIADEETALTLNGKCYEAALDAFGQLIDELSFGRAVATKPNLNERTYFSRSKRPSAGGIISWKRSAHELDALIRALDFGTYPNPLGKAKLAIDDNLFIVSQLEVQGNLSKCAPGTITGIEPNFIQVSTATYDIVVRQVLTISGQALAIADWVEKFGLEVGYQFCEIEPHQIKQIEKFDKSIPQHESFWVKRLASLELLSLPYAQQTALNLGKQGYVSAKMSLPHQVITFLKERRPQWNWGDFLETAFIAYLARIGGTSCFDIGYKHLDLQRQLVETAGLFASVIPHRVDVDCEQSFEQVFQAHHKQVELTKLNLTYAQDVVSRYPALRSLPQLGSKQLFPVVVERVEQLENYQGDGNELSILISSDGKECCWLYNTQVLDADNIARMQQQFAIFLQGIVTQFEESVAYQPLLSEQERYKILVEWNDTEADYAKDKSIHQLFEEQVEKTPNAVAVVFENQQLTYLELNQKANQLAHHLQSLGVQPEVLVGICVERSIEMLVGLLGILKAGGAYVPLDPNYPVERLSYMLADSQLPILLTQQHLFQRLPQNQTQTICLDDWQKFTNYSDHNPCSKVESDNLAYIIYTSGSTGKPKGTMILHSGLINYLSWCTKAYNVAVGVGSSVNSSISFDATITSLFSPLLVGGKVVLLPEEGEIEALKAALSSGVKFSLVKITPAHLEILSHLFASEEVNIQTQAFIIGGEALTEKVTSFWQKYAPETKLINEYGPTETVVGCCVYEVGTLCPPGSNIPIGRPIANTQLYILDSHLQPVPIGIPGELYIGGDGLARGYLNRPELTQEKFIPNPFSDGKSERLYKTGDLACYLNDGNIEYRDRIDHQVKIRGYRIELGEIEALVNSYPQVQQAVVIAREDIPENKSLVAYVVASEKTLTTSQLREFLKEQLPEFMVPSAFVILDTLPLTLNGKIDRKALPAPDGEITREHEYIAPSTPSQEIIANIFASVLGVQNVGIHDNFFELGGHSLLATQLISRLRLAFAVEIPLRGIFESPSVAKLDQKLTQLRTTETGLSVPPIQPRTQREQLPLSFAQERLWFLYQLEGPSATYNMPEAIRITGDLDIQALQQALSEIVRRHEVLRTSFQTVNGTPIQVIYPKVAINVNVVDLQQLEATERETVLQQQAQQEAITPFDLEIAPLIRCSLLRISTREYVLLLTMHHIVSDGWSMGVFIQELSTLYQAFCAGEPSPLPELPIQYADFAIWQRQWLSGEVLESQLNYWQQQLQDAPELLQLPTDRPRPNVQTYRGNTVSFTLNPDLIEKLQNLSRESGTTLFMTL